MPLYRQWVMTLPISLRYLASTRGDLQREIHHEVVETINSFYKEQAAERGIKTPEPGAITFLQRFGTALNLNLHFHILYLDGVYTTNTHEDVIFRKLRPPTLTTW